MFDNVSPLDFRYYGNTPEVFELLKEYASEEAAVKYQLLVEKALVEVLADNGVCGKEVAREVAAACNKITAEEVNREEQRIHHNIRALVNCIRARISESSKPYVHLCATSNDIISTAEAMRLRDVVLEVVIPQLALLEKVLIDLALRERATVQVGRTHGQHAEPLTFGFALAEYVSRLGARILALETAAKNLRGKFAGAVGAYNASSLFFKDPQKFEKQVLAKLGLKAAGHSTQIVEPEYAADVYHALTATFGVLANLADDMRHLQRSEIAEIAEEFTSEQVGSSTMPHKRNPINFENVKSLWKAFMPRMVTMYMDQISEHQRDLTNSASSRFMMESAVALVSATTRMAKAMSRIAVDKKSVAKNFAQGRDMVAAEPLYILLAAHGHPDAHEHVKQMTLAAQKEGKTLHDVMQADKSIAQYLGKFTKEQKEVIEHPERYTGIAAQKTQQIGEHWKKELRRLR